MPNGITNIETYAFYNCKEITNLTIPESFTNIGEEAFAYCTKLTATYFRGYAPTGVGSRVFNSAAYGFKVYYLQGQI